MSTRLVSQAGLMRGASIIEVEEIGTFLRLEGEARAVAIAALL